MGSSGRNQNMRLKEAAEYMLSNSVNLKRTVMSALICVNCKRSTKNWVVLFKCRHIICNICIDMASTNTQTTNEASREGTSRCPACNVIYNPKTDMRNADGMKQNVNDLKDFLIALRANLAEQQRMASNEPINNSQSRYQLSRAPESLIRAISNGNTSEIYRILAPKPTTEQLQNIETSSLNDVPSSSSAISVYIHRPEYNTNDEITASTEINNGDDEITASTEINNGDDEITASTEINNGDGEITASTEINNGDDEITASTEINSGDDKITSTEINSGDDEITASTEINKSSDGEDFVNVTPDKHVL